MEAVSVPAPTKTAAPSGAAGGGLGGIYPNPTVKPVAYTSIKHSASGDSFDTVNGSLYIFDGVNVSEALPVGVAAGFWVDVVNRSGGLSVVTASVLYAGTSGGSQNSATIPDGGWGRVVCLGSDQWIVLGTGWTSGS